MIRANRTEYAQLSGCGLHILTDDELDEIHRATLDVLEDTGLLVSTDEAQEIYYSHGCKVDKKTNIVKIPPFLVEEAIASAPSKILLAGRNHKNDIVVEGMRVAYLNFGVAPQILDMKTGKARESTLKDLAETALMVDAIDNIDGYVIGVVARDVPSQVAGFVATETVFNSTSKHFHQGEILSTDAIRRCFDMAVAVAGSAEELRRRPICSFGICPVSPLQLGREVCEVIIETARLGLPNLILSQALSGATAPVTIAGTLIVHNAEVLGGIVLNQLTRKGSPVIYGSSTCPFDLSIVNAPVGAPETAMISAAVAKLAQYYNLPSWVAGT